MAKKSEVIAFLEANGFTFIRRSRRHEIYKDKHGNMVPVSGSQKVRERLFKNMKAWLKRTRKELGEEFIDA